MGVSISSVYGPVKSSLRLLEVALQVAENWLRRTLAKSTGGVGRRVCCCQCASSYKSFALCS